MSFVRHSKSINNVNGDLLGYHQQAFDIGANINTAGIVRQGGKNYYDPQDGSLAGCWLFDEGMGRNYFDRSPYGHHGYPIGTSKPGRDANGVTFNGTLADDHISIPWPEDFQESQFIDDEGYGSITMLSWVKSDNATPNQDGWLFNTQEPNTAGHGGDYALKTDASGNWSALAVSNVPVETSSFHLIISTRDKTGSKIFVDGVLAGVGSTNTISITAGRDTLCIGNWYRTSSTGDDWDGTVHSVCMYNRALTADEVLVIYNAGMWCAPERLSYAI